MDKPTFTIALKRAQTLSGGYPIKPAERDIFYEALKDERDEDILYALDMVGKSKERICLASILEHAHISRSSRLRDAQEVQKTRRGIAMPESFKDAWKRTSGKKW